MNETQPARMAAADDQPSCPPAVVLQDVLAAYETETRQFELSRGPWVVRGRTWGRGAPLYVLPGMVGSARAYAPLLWLLRDDFRCTVIEYRAPAKRRWRCPAVRISDLAEDLLAVAEMHGDVTIDVYASSFGGMAALQAMLISPPQVGRAVLQGGYAHLDLTACERLTGRLGRFLPGRLRQVPFFQALQRRSHGAWFPLLDRTRLSFFLEDAGSTRLADVCARAGGLARCDLRPELSKISQPVLLVGSEGDGRIRARTLRDLQERLPHASGEELHSCGHLPHLTHPHRVAGLVREFLNGETPLGPEVGRERISSR